MAVKGNNDYMLPTDKYPHFRKIKINGSINIYVIHDLYDMDDDIENYDIVIHGHTHKPAEEYNGKTLIINPGSFGPPRFSLPISLATIDFNDQMVINFYKL